MTMLYLSCLREKDELDLLLCDLLLQMGYATHNVPKTGNRQYGVDIRADNENELLLFVIKQGALNRKNWDDGQNAVRQSLNEIRDCYMMLINGADRTKKLRIVVATNGVIDEAVRLNWEGYKRENAMYSSGTGVAFEPCKDFGKLKEEVNMIKDQFVSETFSFEEYEFPALEFIVSRYYFTLPRVKLENKLN